MGWTHLAPGQDMAIHAVMNSGWLSDQPHISTAVAIAGAESNYNPKAISKTGDYGLWQINKKAHPELFKKYKWDDPVDNARMAKEVYQNALNTFTPWVTYNNGAYRSHIPGWDGKTTSNLDVLKDITPLLAGEAANAVIPGASAVSKLAGSLNPLNWLDWAKGALVSVGIVVLAIVLFVVGVWLILPRDLRPTAVPIPV